MNDFYKNIIEEQKEENNLKDYLLSKQNERIRRCNEIKLMKQEIEQDEIENFWICDNEKRREKMNTMRNLIKDNTKLENDILRKENEHAFKLRQIQDEKNLQFQNIQNSHKLKLNILEMNRKNIECENINKIKELDNINNSIYYNYQLEKIDIENNHQNNMQKSEINIKNELKEMDNKIILLKRKSELNIIKSNQNHELEEKKINNEIEIDKIRIQHKYREKIIEEELKKQIILKRQDLEKEEMEMKLKLMMGQIILKKLYN